MNKNNFTNYFIHTIQYFNSEIQANTTTNFDIEQSFCFHGEIVK